MRKATAVEVVLAGVLLAGCSAPAQPDPVRSAWIEGCTVASSAVSDNDDVNFWFGFCADFYDTEVEGSGTSA